MCTYLDQVRHTYYFRRSVPVELQPFILTRTGKPRTEWKLSLGTKDRDTAKRMIPAHTVETQGLLDAASATLMQAPLPNTLPPANHSPWASEAAFEHWQADQGYQAEQDARHRGRDGERKSIRAEPHRSTAEIGDREAAHRDIRREDRRAHEDAMERIGIARAKRREAANGNAPQDSPDAPPAPAVPATGVMLDTGLVDLWAAERKVLPKGKDTHRALAEWFYARVGRKPVAAITRTDVLTFKSALVTEGCNPANIKVKLSRLRTLLQWAADNDYAATNVATGITIKDIDAAKNKRREFDLASLNAIFASPVYASGARPIRGRGEAAYWLPLLALYTGARLEELGQLRPADIQQIGYPDANGDMQQAWFIRIQEDAADSLRLKNAGSERDVPVHPELVRLGFLPFVEAAIEAKHDRLFPKLVPNIYGKLTAKWGEWFGPYLRGTCGVTDTRMVFHSFRHTFKQYARHAGIIEGVQREIMGHTSADVADAYGSGYPLHQVVEGMGLYKVPGLSGVSSPVDIKS